MILRVFPGHILCAVMLLYTMQQLNCDRHMRTSSPLHNITDAILITQREVDSFS